MPEDTVCTEYIVDCVKMQKNLDREIRLVAAFVHFISNQYKIF